MLSHANVQRTLVKISVGAGLAVVVMYLLPKLVPLGFLGTYFFIYQGPLLVVAFVGLYPFLSKPTVSVSAILGTLFGVIAGVCRMLFSVVQLTNLHYIRRSMRDAETPEAEQVWQHIFDGVFTVQNGISYVMDFFLDWAVFLFAVVMWRHPKFGKVFSILGLIVAGFHFVMKAYSFPEPPAEAGLFDAGPFVSVWAALVFIWVLRNLSWMDESQSTTAA
ncbi:MAG: hypothetical protein ACE5G0_00315 [Rhodothermales bacterium]